MSRLSLVVYLGALISLTIGLPVGNWKIVLERSLDRCPCKVRLGGKRTTLARIASEIIPRSEYNAWITAGRPHRLPRSPSNADPTSLDNVTKLGSPKPFCFDSDKNVPGDFNILLYSSGDDVEEPEIRDIARPECPAGTSVKDYDENEDRDECDNEGNDGGNGKDVSPVLRQGESSSLFLSPSSRIAFGEVVGQKKHAVYNVKITGLHPHKNLDIEHCSGSLIAPQYVLTAAHCKVKKNEHVLIGDYVGHPGEEHLVEDTIPHPEYEEHHAPGDKRIAAFVNDIQLLRLEKPVSDAKNKMIAVNTDCNRPVPCRNALASGYGESAVQDECGKHVLRSAIVKIFGHDDCHRRLRKVHEILIEFCLDESPHICASHGLCGGGLCYGDSGGPLVVADKDDKDDREDVQVGVASYITGNCVDRDHPDVYTRVSEYAGWIHDVTNGTAKFNPSINNGIACPERKIWDTCKFASIRTSGSSARGVQDCTCEDIPRFRPAFRKCKKCRSDGDCWRCTKCVKRGRRGCR